MRDAGGLCNLGNGKPKGWETGGASCGDGGGGAGVLVGMFKGGTAIFFFADRGERVAGGFSVMAVMAVRGGAGVAVGGGVATGVGGGVGVTEEGGLYRG